MAKGRSFEVMPDNFNADKICALVRRSFNKGCTIATSTTAATTTITTTTTTTNNNNNNNNNNSILVFYLQT
jgi:hypothetical protein